MKIIMLLFYCINGTYYQNFGAMFYYIRDKITTIIIIICVLRFIIKIRYTTIDNLCYHNVFALYQ